MLQHILQFCQGNQKAQRYLLGGVEQLIGNVHKDILLPKVPHILKELYDEDIIEEEVLLEWGGKVIDLFTLLPHNPNH